MSLKQTLAPLAGALFVFGMSALAAEQPNTKSPAANPQLAEANRLEAQAQELSKQGKQREALPLFNKVLAIRKAVLGENDMGTALAHNSLGSLLQAQEEYAQARSHFEQALKTVQKLQGNDHPNAAAVHNSLGNVLKDLGDYAAARVHYEDALRIHRKVRGDDHLDTASVHIGLANLFAKQGDFAAARPHQEEALRIQIKALGEEHLDVAAVHNDLGAVLLNQGNLADARRHVEKAWQIRKKILGDQHSITAISQENLGAILQWQADYPAAQRHLEQVLFVQQKLLGDDHPSLAQFHRNLALCLLSQGEYAAATPHMEQALRISQKSHGEEYVETASIHDSLASLLANQGKYSAALPHAEQAFQFDKRVLGAEHAQTVDAGMRLAELEAALAHWDVAGRLVDAARRSSQRHVSRELIYLSEKEQIGFLSQNEESNRDIALSLGAQRPQDPALVNLSASWLLNGKAIGQSAVAARTLLFRDMNRQDPKLDSLLKELESVQQQLATASLAAAKPDQAAAHQARLQALSQRGGDLSRKLAETAGATVQAAPWVELDELRQALPADGVLIDIARIIRFNFRAQKKFERWQAVEYVAWIIPARGAGAVQVIPLGPAEPIDKAVELVRRSIAAAGTKDGLLQQQGERAAEQQVRKDFEAAAKLVWQPLVASLRSAKKLIVSPDGELWLLPWGSLPVAENRFLIEDYALHYVVSGRDLLVKNATKLSTTAPVVLADPDFDLTSERILQALKSLFPTVSWGKNVQMRSVSSVQSTLPKVRRLPGTAAEANAIKDSLTKYAGQAPHTYMSGQALESVYKLVSRPKITVLSTHGFFLSDQEVKRDENPAAAAGSRAVPLALDGKSIENPLLRCGLLLGGCNSSHLAGLDDGILTGMEIVGLDLRGTELVVLSACETGVGQVRNGEGVAGLRQAFQLAGAEAVVATLWQVDDRQSALLMNDFFASLAAGESKTEALRNAQLKRIAARRERAGAAHPYFWAAFTLTGK
jgi:CHAT domain-containing protein/Tfp pilus assembly protein PilF